MFFENIPFVLFRNDFFQQDLLFRDPLEIITAHNEKDFFRAFERLEAKKREGKWLAGYLSYEAGYIFEPKLTPLLPEKRKVPLLCFGVFDRPEEKTSVQLNLIKREKDNNRIFSIHPTWNLAAYTQRFNKLHSHLCNGNSYQGCLTFPFVSEWEGNPTVLFDKLCLKQPVQYGAIISLEKPVILSRSPELFFDINAEGWIQSYPMKGTAARGKSEEEDKKIKKDLANDKKNQTENRMIIDLMRNDISKISQSGTLKTSDLFSIQTFKTLHQMISGVGAKLRPDQSLFDIFSALFPAGSITGVPKISTMAILKKLEENPRNVYCGSIGWIAPNSRMNFNVAIRTITLFEDKTAHINAGSAIVFDSTAESEYEECLIKTAFAKI